MQFACECVLKTFFRAIADLPASRWSDSKKTRVQIGSATVKTSVAAIHRNDLKTKIVVPEPPGDLVPERAAAAVWSDFVLVQTVIVPVVSANSLSACFVPSFGEELLAAKIGVVLTI